MVNWTNPEPTVNGFNKLLNMISRHREYIGRIKEEGELLMHELSKLMSLSMFNQKIG